LSDERRRNSGDDEEAEEHTSTQRREVCGGRRQPASHRIAFSKTENRKSVGLFARPFFFIFELEQKIGFYSATRSNAKLEFCRETRDNHEHNQLQSSRAAVAAYCDAQIRACARMHLISTANCKLALSTLERPYSS
jgi:hypothetical protein